MVRLGGCVGTEGLLRFLESAVGGYGGPGGGETGLAGGTPHGGIEPRFRELGVSSKRMGFRYCVPTRTMLVGSPVPPFPYDQMRPRL